MDNKIIVAFTGLKRAGKSTLAKIIVQELGFKKFSFSNKLKQLTSSLYVIHPKDKEFNVDYNKKLSEAEIIQKLDSFIKANSNKTIEDIDKDIIHEIISYITKFYNEKDLDEKGKLARKIYQLFGTELVRQNLSETFWVDKTLEEIQKSGYNKIVIDDLRFENEYEKLASLNDIIFIPIFVYNTKYKNPVDLHVSELEVLKLKKKIVDRIGFPIDKKHFLDYIEAKIKQRSKGGK